MKRITDPTFSEIEIHPITNIGDLIAFVPLASSKGCATLDAGDYWWLIDDLKISPCWFYNPAASTRSYVTVKVFGRMTSVARLIVGARGSEVVRYHDGNHLNLRRSNLWIDSGASKRDCRQEVIGPLPRDPAGRVLDY